MRRQGARRSGEEMRRSIVEAIAALTERNGRPPTVREIVAAVGAHSTGHVSYHLNILSDEGRVRHDRGTSRGIMLIPKVTPLRPARTRRPALNVPLRGTIAAGAPIEAVEDREAVVDLAGAVMGDDGVYALRVRGTSMIEDFINDGDVVLVRAQETAENGDTVVALLASDATTDGVATLKRFYREKDGRVRLQPANAALEPLYVRPDELQIRGKVVAVYREI